MTRFRHEALSAWLDRIGARMHWRHQVGEGEIGGFELTGYMAGNGATFVVQIWSMGWDIFTSPGTISIGDTLKDAEKRLGLDLPKH